MAAELLSYVQSNLLMLENWKTRIICPTHKKEDKFKSNIVGYY